MPVIVLNNGVTGSHSGSGSANPVDPSATTIVASIGYVENFPNVAKLVPGQPGRIKFVVEEGLVVDKEGVVLLKLDDRQANLIVQKAEAAVKDAEAQYDQALLLPKQIYLKRLQQLAAIQGARSEKGSAEQELNFAQKEYEGKAIPIQKLRGIEGKVNGLKAKVQAEETKLQELKLTYGQTQIARAKADLDAKLAQLEEAKLALDECKIVAPGPGIVLRVLVHKGELFSPQTGIPALQFAQKGVKIVRVEVLQEWASKIEVGQKVEIVDDTYAGNHWTGTVKSVSGWQAHKRTPILEPFNYNDVRIRECVINVNEKPDAPLIIGQRVRALIQTGK